MLQRRVKTGPVEAEDLLEMAGLLEGSVADAWVAEERLARTG